MQQRLALGLLVCLGISVVTSSLAAQSNEPRTQTQQTDPRVQALDAWKGHLAKIGWPAELRDRIAPRFVGRQSRVVDNEHGGKTYTFDGSRPGLLARVVLVLDASGKAVAAPVVEFADTVEAR